MKIRIAITFSVLFLSCKLLIGQTPRKDITPTSPEASALIKATNYPVNFNTGVPDISIPLYEIESGDLKLPIGLSYHAGGFKINEQSTSVGLGWSLSSDIQITRTVNGLDDFKSAIGYLANTHLKTFYQNPGACIGCEYPFNGGAYFGANALSLALGLADGMPDKFSYRLLNKSGSFYFVKNNTGTGYSIQTVPFDNIQITYSNGRFTIIDTDGTTYYFGSENTPDFRNLASQGFEISGEGYDAATQIYYGGFRISAWKCKQINNATKTERIDFNYVAKPVTVATRPVEKIEYFNNDNPCQIGPSINFTNQTNNYSTYQYLMGSIPFHVLSSPKYYVSYPDKVEFHIPYLTYPGGQYRVTDKSYLASEPSVLPAGTYPTGSFRSTISSLALSNIYFRGGSATFNGTDQLNSIIIRNAANELVKTIVLNSSYTAEFNMDYPKYVNGEYFKGTLYLDSLELVGQSPATQNYGFVYNEKTCFGNHLTGSDAWGYYNSKTRRANESSTAINVPYTKIVQKFYNDSYSPCNNYQPDAIIELGNSYDTEVPHEFMMQKGMLHRIIYPTGGHTDFDFEPNLYMENLTDYTGNYQLAQMAGGLRIRSINNYEGTSLELKGQKYYRYGDLEDGIGRKANAPQRTLTSEGKKIYKGFSYKQDIIYYKNPNSSVPAQDKLGLSAWLKETKTTYLSASSMDYSYPSGAPIYYTKVTEYNSDLGVQTGKRVYNYYDANYFEYSSGDLSSIISGTNIPVLSTDGFSGAQKSVLDYKYENGRYKLFHLKEFEYMKYKLEAQTRVAYAYLNNTYQSTAGGAINPNIDIYKNSFGSVYVPIGPDYTLGTYGIASGKLLLTSEREKWINNTDTLHQSTSYTYNKLPYLQPDAITTTGSNRSTITKLFKYSYDFAGTPIYDQMRSVNVNMISQPVDIRILNNAYTTEVSRTITNYGTRGTTNFIVPVSIETSNGGNPLETEQSMLYNDNANVKQITYKKGLIKSYLWGYNYKYPIAEFTGVDYATAIGSNDVVALQNITNEVQLRAKLADLRSNNQLAMVKTFTYKPLVGITSETAANGLDKFYQYDDYNRLLMIKDHNQKILKKFDYHYRPSNRNHPSLNAVYVPNVPMMATYKQHSLGLPGTFLSFNYIIPGGTDFGGGINGANLYAENRLYRNWNNQPGADAGLPASAFANINLSAFMCSCMLLPTDTYIDLIKDESIVASNKFPYAVSNNVYGPTDMMYVLPGQYKVSFRQKPLNGVTIIKYLVTPSVGQAFSIKTGDSLTLNAGISYEIQITNAF